MSVTATRFTRAERLAQIRALVDVGLTHREVAAELGMTRGAVRNILNDPDGSKQKARRVRYRGRCVDCGTPTDGSNGAANASERCAPCRHTYERTVLKVWTRDAVIAAIRRFAAKHGRPPRADEWILSDPVNGYPPRSAIYASGNGYHTPFASWNEAIAAAGFEPRRVGKYERTPEVRRKLSESQKARFEGEGGLGPTQERALRFIRLANVPVTPALIAHATGVNHLTLHQHALRRLCERGLIRKAIHGHYEAAA